MKRLKFRNVPTVVDGKRFASKKEARRYAELRLCEKAGEIKGLELQPSYPLDFNGYHICTYRGDFRYRDGAALVVEDAKGVKTDAYKIKKKLMLAIYGIDVKEV